MKISLMNQAELSGDNSLNNSYGKSASRRFIVTEHNNQRLHWNMQTRTWSSKDIAAMNVFSTAFDQINQYFAYLPEQQQQAIFNKYKEIHNVLRSVTRVADQCEDLVAAITPIVTELFNCINPEHLSNWVWNVLRPPIPASSTAKTFDRDTMPGTRERTYLYDDYIGLIPAVIAFRMVCPFWFDFVELTYDNVNKEHRELVPYGLLSETWLVKSDAMLRLEEFVDHTVGNEKYNPAAILLGIGSSNFVYWIISALVINRIVTVDIMGLRPDKQVVSALYNFIVTRVSGLYSSQPNVNNKFAESSYASDENNQSFLEGFRHRIELTVGQEADGDYAIERVLDQLLKGSRDPLDILERVAPGIDHNLVRDALATATRLDIGLVCDAQINFAAWLFHPYSQVRASNNFHSGRILTLLGLAQAVLLHQGKVDLAMIVTAQCVRAVNDGSVHVLGETIATFKASDREVYRSTFPLEKPTRNPTKPINYVMEDIYKLVLSLQDYDITCSFSDETLAKVQGTNTSRRYFLKKNAVTMVMEYAVELANRPIIRADPDLIYQQLAARMAGAEFINNRESF